MEEMRQDDNPETVNILVVEDSPTQAEQLRYLLEQNGYTVQVARNGREALEVLATWRPTLIVSDIVMPEMDGYALCRAVKSDPDLKHIPVVIVTSLSAIQDIARALECGADNFIRKPYDPRMLLARIHYILLNLNLRQGKKVVPGTELYLEGKKHLITSEREQIVDLLISTYEEAVQMNEELQVQQKEIARSNQVLAALYRIAEELNGVSTEAEVCERLLSSVLELPKFDSAWIFLEDEGVEGGCRLVAEAGLPECLSIPARAGDCACWRRFRSGDEEHEPAVVECERLGNECGGGSHASVPICANERCFGVVNLVAAPGEDFDPEDLRMLDAIGNQLAVALERARLYEHLESLVARRTAALQAEVVERKQAQERVARLNRIHEVLSGINNTIVRARDRETLFQDACRLAVEQGGFGLAWIGMQNHDPSSLKLMAWQAADKGLEEKVREVVTAFSASKDTSLDEVLHGGRTMMCRDLEIGSDIPFAVEALARGYRSMVGLPLLEGGKPAGILALYASEPHLLDEEELKLLEEVAGDISYALDYLAKEAKISYLAYYDVLTGLPNRSLMLDRLHHGISLAQRHGQWIAVIYLDIDRFQIINDGLGHHIGDRLLRAIGDRLTGDLRDGDTAARLGGDEFAVLCCDLAGEEDVEQMIQQVQLAFQSPFKVEGGNDLRVTASLGVSIHPADGDDPASLLKYAGLAMYRAKEMGRNQVQRFKPEFNLRVEERLEVESRLVEALKRNELVLYYQPQFNAQSGAIDGMEALIRWRHPELGLVPPGQFIPVAEESGLIERIGEWVMREACRQNQAWQEAGLSNFPVSVNLSMAQFREGSLMDSIVRILDETRLDPRYLELELTESLVMSNAESFISFLQEIKSHGVLVAIDDFGTGYSSLNYLKRLPVDRLKVDYTFVRDITVDPSSASICRAVVAIAHNLHLGVVAEGVESDAQATYLADHRCDSLQGFHLQRPAPAEEITALLRRHAAARRQAH